VNINFIVSARDPLSVLKIEFFSTRLEAGFKEPLSVRKREFFSAKLENRLRELLKPLKSEFFWVRLDPRFKEPLSGRKIELFSERLDAEPTEAERDWVDATLPLRSTAIATHTELVPRHSVFVTEVLPVLSNPEPVTRPVEPPEATRALSLPTRFVVQSPLFPTQLNPATAKSLLLAVVKTMLGLVLEPVLTALLPTLVTPRYTKTTNEFLPDVPPENVAVTV